MVDIVCDGGALERHVVDATFTPLGVNNTLSLIALAEWTHCEFVERGGGTVIVFPSGSEVTLRRRGGRYYLDVKRVPTAG
jgi:hypothetical protein